ncbi:hypothetical protein GGI11_008711 [Coemansia sp. RSA 2049]|nr:hypothetical protein GGI11_008711 [Coemansia sp. RSA 2049]KAJ2511169.1 hypothetical protein H4217_007517 [Coemansia sp. RSA 1939]KAJ2606448.1 hypothetical protein EV177_005925 [Coemansia sp. RSA 1804]
MTDTTPASEGKHQQGLKYKEAALKQYHFSLLHLRGLNTKAKDMVKPNTPEEVKEEDVTEQDKELSAIYSNMAACHMRLQRYDRVVKCSEQALKSNAYNKKAKFRLAQGHVRTGALEKATKILDELAEQSPDDEGIAAERRNMKVVERQAEEKQRKQFAGMFDRAKKSDD